MTTPTDTSGLIETYGATLKPTLTNGTFLEFAQAAAKKLVGATGLKVPDGVFKIIVTWPGAQGVRMNITFKDGTARSQRDVIPRGGGVLRHHVRREHRLHPIHLSPTGRRNPERHTRHRRNHLNTTPRLTQWRWQHDHPEHQYRGRELLEVLRRATRNQCVRYYAAYRRKARRTTYSATSWRKSGVALLDSKFCSQRLPRPGEWDELPSDSHTGVQGCKRAGCEDSLTLGRSDRRWIPSLNHGPTRSRTERREYGTGNSDFPTARRLAEIGVAA